MVKQQSRQTSEYKNKDKETRGLVQVATLPYHSKEELASLLQEIPRAPAHSMVG
jgi:hypothetical protein